MTETNDFLGNKQDILKYLNCRMTGYGIQEANQYFSKIEVSIKIIKYFTKIEKYSKYTSFL